MSQCSRREFVRNVALGAAGLGALPARALFAGEAAKKPNIVYVFADQHRQCSWPEGGDSQVKTPNLEALARDGVTFNHCVSTYPLCSPYRATLLTGRFPQAHTVTANVAGMKGALPPTETTIADELKKAGYVTGYVGKWHLYPGHLAGKIVPPGPHRHGFDWWRVSYNYRKRYDTRYHDDHGKEIVLQGYAPKSQMDLVLEFIEKNVDRPFCIFLSWHPPHPPYAEAPQEFVRLYPHGEIKLRPNVPKEAAGKKLREEQVQYFGHVSALDEEVGRLMKKLAQLGLAENTIVCYSSDHGDMLGSFDLWGKRKPWEESIGVPFVIRWPAAIAGGRKLDTLFATVDIAPTLLGLVGLPPQPRMQGTDISAILKGKDAPGPESAFIMSISGPQGMVEEDDEVKAENERGKNKAKGNTNWRGVRTSRYTYVKHGKSGAMEPWLLYDNEKDPHQLHNLVDDPAQAQTRKGLSAMLRDWQKRVGEA